MPCRDQPFTGPQFRHSPEISSFTDPRPRLAEFGLESCASACILPLFFQSGGCVETEKTSKSNANLVWGLILVALGVFLLLDNLNILDVDHWWHYWPMILVIVGMNKMIDFESPKEFVSGIWFVVLGLWLYACFEHIWGLTFRNSWPVLMIGWGVCEVLKAVLQRNGGQHHGK